MKRHIALLLAVVMCISFLPANFAAATDVNSEAVRTIYTDEMIENARQNIEEFSWAESQKNSAVSKAEAYLALGADFFWTHVTSQGVPRAYHLGMEGATAGTSLFDPQRYICRGCEEDLYPIGSNYPWRVDPVNNPWKITCPACGESFPSNDFGKFYELGMKNSPEGKFDRIKALEAHREMLIEQELLPMEAANMAAPGEEYTADWYAYYGYGVEGGFLHNDLHADKGDARWGVDDGFGYVTDGEPPVGDDIIGRVVPYIALYNHFANFQSGNNNLVSVVSTLGNAYMYTGDARYGILGAIILDRFADNYPDYALNVEDYVRYPNNNGGPNAGKAVGRIWECFVAETLAQAYDKLKPAFDEPEVIEFLEDKAAYYGINGDKSSGDAIRANIEEGILLEIFDAAQKAQIFGNFGLHQQAVLSAAVALDDPEMTPEMINWLYADSEVQANFENGDTYNNGGDINSMFIDGLYRDGQNLESPSYNNMGISSLLSGAVTLERYAQNGGEIGNNFSILSHPKYLALINSFRPLYMGHKGVPGLADSGTAASYSQWPYTEDLLTAFQVLKDSTDAGVKAEVVKIAQQLYERIGTSSHYDIWAANPESLYDDVCEVIDAYGEYESDKSTIQTGYGYAVLRSGTLLAKKNLNGIKDTQGAYMLNFSGHYKHNHGDYLDLLIEAYGMGMTTDLGYPETPVAGDPHSHEWASTAFAHNTVIIDNANHGAADGTPQEPIHYDATSSKVQVIDARTPDAYADADEFRRTVVMVNFDDEVSYGVDFFNVKGGSDHLYGFTPNSNDRPESNLEFGAVRDVYDEDSAIAAYNTWMEDAQTATPSENNFYLDYQITDFKGYSQNKDLDVNLRVTMLNDVDEVSLVTTTPQRIATNEKIGLLERFVVRRNASESLFTAVYEPYANDTRYIANISEIAAEGAKVVKVEFVEDRIDYIIYSENKADITVTDGAISFPFQGFVGVYSVTKDGAQLYSYVNDGSKIGAMTDKAAAVTGTVVDFNKDIRFDNYIDVAVEGDVDVDALAGRMFVQDNAATGNAAYVIESAEDNGDTIRLNLGNVSTTDATGVYIPVANAAFSIPMSYEDAAAIDKVVITENGAEVSEISTFVNKTHELAATVLPADAANTAVEWASDNAEVATVEDGVVTAVGTGTAYITAKAVLGGRTGKVKVVVLSEDNMTAATQKYVTTKAAFNTANMLSSDKYSTAPVLRLENYAIYFRDAMNWEYEVPAEYAKDGVAFDAMNLDATAPWALVANGVTMGSIFVSDANMYQEFSPSRYASGANYVVLRLNVANKGEYILKATGAKSSVGAAPAVYFFKDDEDVDYENANAYPADSKLPRYFDLSKSGEHALGRVTVDFPGDYIVAFVADETSVELNSAVASNNTQSFSLTGIELVPNDEDVVTGLSVSADKSYLVAGEELALDVKLVYEIFGEDELDPSKVTFETSDDKVATVADGVVTAKAAGDVTITITSGELEETVDFTVVEAKDPYKINYTTHLGAFNFSTQLMKLPADVGADGKTPLYQTEPYLRNAAGGILYYKPAMHWDYVVPAAYTSDGKDIDPYMDLTKTAPWALESQQQTVGSLMVYNGMMAHEANRNAFWNGDTRPRLTLRLFVDAPGEYLLKVRANTGANTPVQAVYFFKDGVAKNNALPSTYPTASKVGYADFMTGASDYRVVGTVKADEVGEYIISFLCDNTSAEKNTTATQVFYLKDIMLDPISSEEKLSFNFTSEAFNYDQMKGVTGIVSKVTDDYYYRDLAAELGWDFAPNAVMIMNEKLANPDLKIPAGYYGSGKPAADFYAMNLDNTDPWAFAGANAVDVATSPKFQIRGSRANNGDGLHPYFNADMYTDDASTQFIALSLDIPAAGEYIMNVDAGRGTAKAAPAVYFFKDTGKELTNASFITSATKLGYINSANTAAANKEYFTNVEVPEAGKYVVALVMDSTSKTLAPTTLTAHGVTNAQYIQLYGIDLTPLDRGELQGISFKNATVSVAAGDEKAIELIGQYAEMDAEIVNLDGFEFAVEGDAAVVENGVIKGVKEGTATVTATYGDLTATATINVFNAAEQVTLEYVTTLGAFNTDKMVASTAYTTTPTLRSGVGIYYLPMIDWTYEVPAEYSSTDPQAAFMAMDTTTEDGDAKLTDPWAYVHYGAQSYRLMAGGFLLETKATSHHLALKVDVPAAGEYFLQMKGGKASGNPSPVMATYFFKDGTTDVANNAPATWTNYATGNFDTSKTEYTTVATVNVTEAGSYIVGLLASNYSGTQEDMLLSGIKLIPTKDDVSTGIAVAASMPEIHVGESTELSVAEVWQYAGLKDAILGDYTFSTDSANVEIDGNVVTGLEIAENPAIITATHKTDATRTATVAIKVVPYAEELEYIIGTSAFNTATMIEGDAYTTTPVLRTTHRIFYYQPAMHWDYTIPAEYTSDSTPVKIMNLEATAPWAFEAARVHVGSPALYSGNMTFEMKPSSYTTSAPSFISFRLKVAAPGSYKLYTKALRSTTAPVPAVYFNDELVEYFDIPNAANEYVELGTVIVPTSGEYVVKFVGDATSLEKNPSETTQTMQLNAIKLVPVTGMDPNPPVVEEAITSISLEAADTELLEEEKTQLTVKAVTESGAEKTLDPSEVTFSVDPAGAARVTAAGVVTAYREGTAVITATYGDLEATVEIEVYAEKEQRVYEFVTSLAGMNTDKIKWNDEADPAYNYNNYAVLRNIGSATNKVGYFYYTPAMTWKYEQTAQANEADPYYGLEESFYTMDTTIYDGDEKLTDKWELIAAAGGWGTFHLTSSISNINLRTANYGTHKGSPYVAYRLTVDAAGEYYLNLKAAKKEDAAVPAVYFFKDGAEGVAYDTPSTYPADSKIGYFNMTDAEEYSSMGKLTIATPGEYVIAFNADATSLEKNATTSKDGTADVQWFNLAGVQLVPTEDDVLSGIELSTDKVEIRVGEQAKVSLKEIWKISGEKEPETNSAGSYLDYNISSSDADIATVWSNGVVTAMELSENPITITVQHKTTGLKATVDIKIVADPTELEYIIGTKAFNTATMIEGDAYTTTPVLRTTHRIFYYRPAMHWDYEIPAEYTSDGVAVKIMNLEATAPWAFESYFTNVGSNPALYSGHMAFEYKPANFSTGAQHVAYRLKVAAPGEYYIQAQAVRDAKAPVPTVYFNDEKVGSFDIPNAANAYATIGKVSVPVSGEYVIKFVGDATSAEKNPYADGNQVMNLNAIKLIPVEDNAITGLEATIDKAEMFKGETAQISIEESFSISGTGTANFADYKLTTSNAKVATVVDYKSNAATAGTVTAVGAGEAVITATHRATGAEVTINVKVCPDPTTLEYVTTLGAFNTDKMMSVAPTDTTIDGSANAYSRHPVQRSGVGIYYTPMIDWTYEVPAEYSTTDPQAAFMAMDITEDDGDAKLTDPWAYAHQYGQSYRLMAGGFLLETKLANHFLALKVDVPAPGEYFLQMKGGKASGNPSPVMVAYFFKDGAVSNIKDSSTWNSYKLSDFDTAKTEYTNVATINAPTSGTYVVGLVAANNTGAQEDMLLSGIKLIPTSFDVVSGVTLSADTTKLGVGKTANLTVEGAKAVTGAFDLDIADVEIAVEGDAVTVANGVVTAAAAGTATVTATYEGKTSSLEFTVIDFSNAVDHEYVIAKEAFNHELMMKHTGTNPTNYEYTKYAVLRANCIYYRPAMSWKYVQEKIDSDPTYDVTASDGKVTTYDVPYTDLEKPFNTMNLDATDKWELISYNFSGSPRIQEGIMFSEVPQTSLNTAARHIAFRVVVEQPGEYEIFAKGSKVQDTVVEAVPYFFKDGVATGNGSPSTYPEDAKLARFTATGGEYQSLGTVTVYEAGDYIVSFVVDAEAIAKIPADATSYVEMSLSGIKLEAVAEPVDELVSLEVEAEVETGEEVAEIGDYIYATVWAEMSLSGTVEVFEEDGVEYTWTEGLLDYYGGGEFEALDNGTATITAEYMGQTATVEVVVGGGEEPEPTDDLVSIALSATPAEVEVEKEITLAVTGTYSLTGEKAIESGVTYTVAPEGAVTFNGNVATAAVAGNATITATFEGKTATAEVVINPKTIPVEGVELDKTVLEMTEGDEATLVATVIPSDATEDKTVTWSVEGDAVTVDGGVVTAVKAGTATVKVALVANPAIYKTVEVTVAAKEIAATGITLDKETLYLSGPTEAKGTWPKSETLTAQVYPVDAENQAVKWTSSNTDVATVDENGVVTSKRAGTTIITATTEDGEHTATCTVNVALRSYGNTLSLKDVIYVKVVTDLTEFLNMGIDLEEDAGMLCWTEKEFAELNGQIVYDENYAIKGLTYYGKSGGLQLYNGTSEAYIQRQLGDVNYYSVYIKLADGTYAYTEPVLYGPQTYAYNQINKTTTAESLKNVCIALLNYATAAQDYFLEEDEISVYANAELTAEQKAMVWNDDAANFTLAGDVPEDKQRTADAIFAKMNNTLRLKELIQLVAVHTVAQTHVSTAKRSGTIFWTKEQFESLEGVPSLENIGEGTIVEPLAEYPGSNGAMWEAIAPTVSAKDIANTYYYMLGFVETSEGEVKYSAVKAYSIEQYLYNVAVRDYSKYITNNPKLLELVQRLYIYERAAKIQYNT